MNKKSNQNNKIIPLENNLDKVRNTLRITDKLILGNRIAPFLKRNGKYCFIRTDNMQPISNKEFDFVFPFEGNVARININNKFGLINAKGEFLISPKYDEIHNFNGDYAKVRIKKKVVINQSDQKSFKKLIDKGLYDHWYEQITISEDELTIEFSTWGYINKFGNEVIEPKYYYISDLKEDCLWVNCQPDGYRLMNIGGEFITNSKYYAVSNFSEGLARVLDEKVIIYYINKFGERVLSFKLGEERNTSIIWLMSDFHNGVATIEKNGKMGFIDKSGNEVSKVKYDYIANCDNIFKIVTMNGKDSILDENFNEIIPYKYDHISSVGRGLAAVSLNNKKGLINKDGKELTKIVYDRIDKFYDGLARVIFNNKYGFINELGKEVISTNYEKVSDFSEGLAIVKLNGKLGFIDRLGNVALPIKFDKANVFKNWFTLVLIDNEHFYIDKNGIEYKES